MPRRVPCVPLLCPAFRSVCGKITISNNINITVTLLLTGHVSGVSVWRCCHDARVFTDCVTAVDIALTDTASGTADKRRTKYFLGRKRGGVKYFLGKRGGSASLVDRGAPQLTKDLHASRRDTEEAANKRVKYFLG